MLPETSRSRDLVVASLSENDKTSIATATQHTVLRQEARLPKGIPKTSRDIFLAISKNGCIELVPSFHDGHTFFISLTEMNRTLFVDNWNKPNNISYRIAYSICNKIFEKENAKIYVQARNSSEWRDAGNGNKAKTLLYGAMKSLVGINRKDLPVLAPNTKSSKAAIASLKRARCSLQENRADTTTQSTFRPRKRVRFFLPPPPEDAVSVVKVNGGTKSAGIRKENDILEKAFG